MAKTETPKTEKVIDLTPKAEKINAQELAKLQATIKTIDSLTVDVGRIEVQKYGLMKAMGNVQQDIETIRQEFNDKYGTDNINIQDGTIGYPPENPNPEGNQTPNPEENPTQITQENGETNKED